MRKGEKKLRSEQEWSDSHSILSILDLTPSDRSTVAEIQAHVWPGVAYFGKDYSRCFKSEQRLQV